MIDLQTFSRIVLLGILMLCSPLAAQQTRWERASMGLDGGTIQTFGFGATGEVYAGGRDGLYRLVDDSRWEMILRDVEVHWIGTGPDGTMLMLGTPDSMNLANLYRTGYRERLRIYPANLYRSTDNGRTWQISRTTLETIPHIAPDGTLYQLETGVLQRSEDMGATWQQLQVPTPNPIWDNRTGVLVVDSNGVLIFSPYDSSIYVSTDRGESWQHTGSWLPYVNTERLDILPDGRLMAYGKGYTDSVPPYVSSDHGRSWQKGDSMMTAHRRRLPGGDLVAYYETRFDEDRSRGMFRSANNGQSWSRVDNQLVQAFDVAPDGTIWRSVWPNVYRSVDGGSSWQQITAGLEHIMPVSPVTDGAGNLYLMQRAELFDTMTDYPYLDHCYAIFHSGDSGSSWQKVTDSMWPNWYPGSYQDLQVDNAGRLYCYRMVPPHEIDPIGFGLAQMVSRDGGWTWAMLNGGYIHNVRVERNGVVTGKTLDNYEVRKLMTSLDGGSTWKVTAHPFGIRGYVRTARGVIVAHLSMLDYDERNGIYRSLDDGTTWEPVITGIEEQKLAFSSDSSGTIYFSGNLDLVDGRSGTLGIYRSVDNGATFEKTLDSVSYPNFVAAPPGRMYVNDFIGIDSGTIWKTDDRGATWKKMSMPNVWAREIFTAEDGTLYCTAPIDRLSDTTYLFRSLDDGVTWERFDAGLPVTDLDFPSMLEMPGGRLFVSTPRGMYRTTVESPGASPVKDQEMDLSFETLPNRSRGR